MNGASVRRKLQVRGLTAAGGLQSGVPLDETIRCFFGAAARLLASGFEYESAGAGAASQDQQPVGLQDDCATVKVRPCAGGLGCARAAPAAPLQLASTGRS